MKFIVDIAKFRDTIQDLNEDANFVKMEYLGSDWVFIYQMTSASILLLLFFLLIFLFSLEFYNIFLQLF